MSLTTFERHLAYLLREFEATLGPVEVPVDARWQAESFTSMWTAQVRDTDTAIFKIATVPENSVSHTSRRFRCSMP